MCNTPSQTFSLSTALSYCSTFQLLPLSGLASGAIEVEEHSLGPIENIYDFIHKYQIHQ
jgi:hypothetical protein